VIRNKAVNLSKLLMMVP